uniref:Uncharacterized protein n=1 Tax=Geospiza parvula TaxID=87175 RepID=A0A8C3NJQ2_GEOPR
MPHASSSLLRICWTPDLSGLKGLCLKEKLKRCPSFRGGPHHAAAPPGTESSGKAHPVCHIGGITWRLIV